MSRWSIDQSKVIYVFMGSLSNLAHTHPQILGDRVTNFLIDSDFRDSSEPSEDSLVALEKLSLGRKPESCH